MESGFLMTVWSGQFLTFICFQLLILVMVISGLSILSFRGLSSKQEIKMGKQDSLLNLHCLIFGLKNNSTFLVKEKKKMQKKEGNPMWWSYTLSCARLVGICINTGDESQYIKSLNCLLIDVNNGPERTCYRWRYNIYCTLC